VLTERSGADASAPGIARAFLAVVPPSEVLDTVEEATAPTRAADPELRWVRRGAWHITLQFLGRVEHVDVLVDALAVVAARSEPFSMQLRGAGAFPSAKRGAVLWAGVGEGTAEIEALAGAVVDATAALGFATEGKPFHAHLTLARARPPRRLVETVTALEPASWGPAWTVDSVALVQSDTRPDGAVYTQRAQVPLGP
jgi:2'-5' RNA ligase